MKLSSFIPKNPLARPGLVDLEEGSSKALANFINDELFNERFGDVKLACKIINYRLMTTPKLTLVQTYANLAYIV